MTPVISARPATTGTGSLAMITAAIFSSGNVNGLIQGHRLPSPFCPRQSCSRVRGYVKGSGRWCDPFLVAPGDVHDSGA